MKKSITFIILLNTFACSKNETNPKENTIGLTNSNLQYESDIDFKNLIKKVTLSMLRYQNFLEKQPLEDRKSNTDMALSLLSSTKNYVKTNKIN